MGRKATGSIVERPGKHGPVLALRFRAYGQRRYLTLGAIDEGWTRTAAEQELGRVLAAVRLGVWQPPSGAPEPGEEPSFHVFASRWIDRRQHEVGARTADTWRWALSTHLLPQLKSYRLSEITPEVVDTYRTRKLREGRLKPQTINLTLKVLAAVLDSAVEYGYLTVNPARGRNRRLKAAKPRRTWLELDQVRALLDAAGNYRPLVATMILAGLRVSELTALRWRDVDLARGKLLVAEAKTEAGVREVDLTPNLQAELERHREKAGHPDGDTFVFPTKSGRRYHAANISTDVLGAAVKRANAKLQKDEKQPMRGVTNHSLRRTFASLLYEAGASPAYVMGQMGHTSATMALEVYSRMMARDRDTGARMDALISGSERAQTGTNGTGRNKSDRDSEFESWAGAGIS